MGGRGTFAAGNPVPYSYETVGKIGGVKVLQKLDKRASGGLPEEAHSSSAYILLNKSGDFRMYREYDKNHYLRLEIAYHPEKSIDPSRKPVLHIHEYKSDNFADRTTRPLTKHEFRKYKKYFKGLKQLIGMKMSEFIDKIYYGDEIEFKIADTTYFIQGTKYNGKFRLTVDYWNKSDGTEPQHDYLLSIECNSAGERLQKFEDAKIFNGKCIYDIESEIEVLFG